MYENNILMHFESIKSIIFVTLVEILNKRVICSVISLKLINERC